MFDLTEEEKCVQVEIKGLEKTIKDLIVQRASAPPDTKTALTSKIEALAETLKTLAAGDTGLRITIKDTARQTVESSLGEFFGAGAVQEHLVEILVLCIEICAAEIRGAEARRIIHAARQLFIDLLGEMSNKDFQTAWAKVTFARYGALVACGFSGEEAMAIVVAEAARPWPSISVGGKGT